MLKDLFFSVLILFLVISCARVGSPTGGPKDEKPPVTLSAVPDFGTLNFKDTKIRIYFDEYIKFKELNKQLILSPPMQYAPEITPSGIASKYINIKIVDTLKPNTTYTFNFGNAIVDNAEGNPLKQFKYVFSTGSYIDSLQVKGTIADAWNAQPEKDVLVMLYAVTESFNDSIVYNQKPEYVTNTLDSTAFALTHIKAGKYLMIALKDKSNNLKFNEKEDKIGFLNSFIDLPQDSVKQHITLFKPEPEFAIKKVFEVSKNHAQIAFEGKWQPVIQSVTDNQGVDIPFVLQKEVDQDSINIWYKEVTTDSITVHILKQNKVEPFTFKPRSTKKDSLKITSNVRSVLHFRDTLSFAASIPIESLNNQYIQLVESDSIPVTFRTEIHPNRDRFFVYFDRKPSTTYTLSAFPQAMTDFYGQVNDTLVNKFNVRRLEDYGEIKLQVKRITTTPIIIQLLTDKGKVVSTEFCTTAQSITFSNLEPQKYILKAIFDDNDNKMWDTGNYLRKRQPEKIVYHPKTIELRANWTVNEEFMLE